MFSEVFGPKRGSLASRPSCAAASSSGSESMPRTSWIWRILATPSPEISSISTSPAGSAPAAPRAGWPVRCRPARSTICSVAGPTPFVAASDAVLERRRANHREAADGPRGGAKRPDPEGIFALELEEGGDLLQHLGDRLLVHEVLHISSASGRAPTARSRVRGCATPARAAPPPGREQRPAALRPAASGAKRRAVGAGQPAGPRPGHLHHAEARAVGPEAEDAEHPEVGRPARGARNSRPVARAAPRHDSAQTRRSGTGRSRPRRLGGSGDVGRRRRAGSRELGRRARRRIRPASQKQVGVVHQGGELVHALAQCLLGPRDRGSGSPPRDPSGTRPGRPDRRPAAVERGSDAGEALVGDGGEDEVERGGAGHGGR